MAYEHLIDRCFAETIGDAGLERAAFEKTLGQTAAVLASLKKMHDDGRLPLLQLPAARDDLDLLRPVADRFRDAFDDIVILGTGGSSLGGQTLYALVDRGFGPPPGVPRLHFMDNVDPNTFDTLLDRLDLTRSGFIVISKSGSTTETMAQFLVCLRAVRHAAGEGASARHFLIITEPQENPLRLIADRLSIETLDHDPGVGGRFSVLSLVGLLPAMIVGLDVEALRAGAHEVLAPVLAAKPPAEIPPAAGAAVSVALNRANGISSTVLMPYVDRLADFGLWYRQLWAESLGKDGAGTTPIRAMGTVDQHSQLQLYLDGPADKMFTVVMLACAGRGPQIPVFIAVRDKLGYLVDRTMGDVMDAEQRATAETLAANGRPTRVIRIEALDERVMGALLMHFMLETIIAAGLLGVDAFDQPAVEQGKVLTRQYLSAQKDAPPS